VWVELIDGADAKAVVERLLTALESAARRPRAELTVAGWS
jgi:hypothetical protein